MAVSIENWVRRRVELYCLLCLYVCRLSGSHLFRFEACSGKVSLGRLPLRVSIRVSHHSRTPSLERTPSDLAATLVYHATALGAVVVRGLGVFSFQPGNLLAMMDLLQLVVAVMISVSSCSSCTLQFAHQCGCWTLVERSRGCWNSNKHADGRTHVEGIQILRMNLLLWMRSRDCW